MNIARMIAMGLLGGGAATVTLPRYLETNNGSALEGFETLTGWTAEAGTQEIDAVNVLTGTNSIKVTNPGGSTAAGRIAKTISWGFPDAGPDRIRLYYFVHSGCAVNLYGITIRIYNAGGGYMEFAITQSANGYIDGWNALDIYAVNFTSNGGAEWTDTFTTIRIYTSPINSAVSVSVSYDSIYYGIENTPAVMFTFDDGYSSDYTIAFAYMSSKHVYGTSFVQGDRIDAGGLTSAQIVAMDAAGWGIGNHANNASYALEDYQSCKAILDALNLTKSPDHAAYPLGAYDSARKVVVSTAGMLTARHTKNYVYPSPTIGMANAYEIGGRQIGSTVDLATAKSYIDAAKTGNKVVGLFFHELVNSGASSLQWNKSDFEALVDYAIAEGLPFLTAQQLYAAASGPVNVLKPKT